MHLTIEQSGVLAAICVGGTTGAWNVYQLVLARQKAERERIALAEEKEHRLTMLESLSDTLQGVQNDQLHTLKSHELRIEALENPVAPEPK